MLPIVVVRRAAVVRLAGAQLAADALDEHGAVLFGERVFALLGRQIGVQIFQLLCGDEGDIGGSAAAYRTAGDTCRARSAAVSQMQDTMPVTA